MEESCCELGCVCTDAYCICPPTCSCSSCARGGSSSSVSKQVHLMEDTTTEEPGTGSLLETSVSCQTVQGTEVSKSNVQQTGQSTIHSSFEISQSKEIPAFSTASTEGFELLKADANLFQSIEKQSTAATFVDLKAKGSPQKESLQAFSPVKKPRKDSPKGASSLTPRKTLKIVSDDDDCQYLYSVQGKSLETDSQPVTVSVDASHGQYDFGTRKTARRQVTQMEFSEGPSYLEDSPSKTSRKVYGDGLLQTDHPKGQASRNLSSTRQSRHLTAPNESEKESSQTEIYQIPSYPTEHSENSSNITQENLSLRELLLRPLPRPQSSRPADQNQHNISPEKVYKTQAFPKISPLISSRGSARKYSLDKRKSCSLPNTPTKSLPKPGIYSASSTVKIMVPTTQMPRQTLSQPSQVFSFPTVFQEQLFNSYRPRGACNLSETQATISSYSPRGPASYCSLQKTPPSGSSQNTTDSYSPRGAFIADPSIRRCSTWPRDLSTSSENPESDSFYSLLPIQNPNIPEHFFEPLVSSGLHMTQDLSGPDIAQELRISQMAQVSSGIQISQGSSAPHMEQGSIVPHLDQGSHIQHFPQDSSRLTTAHVSGSSILSPDVSPEYLNIQQNQRSEIPISGSSFTHGSLPIPEVSEQDNWLNSAPLSENIETNFPQASSADIQADPSSEFQVMSPSVLDSPNFSHSREDSYPVFSEVAPNENVLKIPESRALSPLMKFLDSPIPLEESKPISSSEQHECSGSHEFSSSSMLKESSSSSEIQAHGSSIAEAPAISSIAEAPFSLSVTETPELSVFDAPISSFVTEASNSSSIIKAPISSSETEGTDTSTVSKATVPPSIAKRTNSSVIAEASPSPSVAEGIDTTSTADASIFSPVAEVTDSSTADVAASSSVTEDASLPTAEAPDSSNLTKSPGLPDLKEWSDLHNLPHFDESLVPGDIESSFHLQDK